MFYSIRTDRKLNNYFQQTKDVPNGALANHGQKIISLMRLCRQPAMNGKMLRELALQVCFSKKKNLDRIFTHCDGLFQDFSG